MKVELTNELQRAMLKTALEEKREWEAEHNQDEAVEAIDSLLNQI